MYNHVEQATMLRQEQVLKARGIQSASVDGGARYVEHSCVFFHLLQRYYIQLPNFAANYF